MVTIGCAVGSAVIPVSAGYLFAHVAPMAVWHLNLGLVLVQLVTAVALALVLRGGAMLDKTGGGAGGVSYEKLTQNEDFEENKNMEDIDLQSD